MMTVEQLIEYLQTFQPDLPVAFRLCSEYMLLRSNDIEVLELGVPRADGWVCTKRPDKETALYLVFPGN